MQNTTAQLVNLCENLMYLLGIALSGKGEDCREIGNEVFAAYPGELPSDCQELVRFIFNAKDQIDGLNIDKETLNYLMPEPYPAPMMRAMALVKD